VEKVCKPCFLSFFHLPLPASRWKSSKTKNQNFLFALLLHQQQRQDGQTQMDRNVRHRGVPPDQHLPEG